MSEKNNGRDMLIGFRFAIYPMTDDFVKIIKGALKQVDTSQVEMKTDDITTLIRGERVHVFDVAAAVFIHAAKTGTHVVMNGTFIRGGPEEAPPAAGHNSEPRNTSASNGKTVEAAAQTAFYHMENSDYLQLIEEKISIAKSHGTYTKTVPYATRLDGEANTVFRTLEAMFNHAGATEQHVHTAMTAVVSANSPSRKK